MMGGMIARALDTEAADKGFFIFAEMERSVLSSAFDLADATGVDRPEQVPDVDGRKEMLKSLARSVLNGSFPEWWAENVGTELYDSTPDPSHVGAGTDSDVWREQIEAWAAGVREQHDGIDATDRELASVACDSVYGVDLAEYEERVVEWDRRETLDALAAGNMREAKRIIDDATEAVEDGDT